MANPAGYTAERNALVALLGIPDNADLSLEQLKTLVSSSPSDVYDRSIKAFKYGRVDLGAQGADYTLGAAYASPLNDIAIAGAVAGAWIEVGTSLAVDNGAGDFLADVATIVAAAPVNYLSSRTASDNGLGGWFRPGGAYAGSSGVVMYQLKAGDIVAGVVTLRLLVKSPGVRKILTTVGNTATFWARLVA